MNRRKFLTASATVAAVVAVAPEKLLAQRTDGKPLTWVNELKYEYNRPDGSRIYTIARHRSDGRMCVLNIDPTWSLLKETNYVEGTFAMFLRFLPTPTDDRFKASPEEFIRTVEISRQHHNAQMFF